MPEILRGRLGPIRLASVLQLAETEVFTGRAQLAEGELSFFKGRLVAARCGALDGVTALCELFIGETGEFALLTEAVAEAPSVGPMLALIIEGCRLADEWARVSPLVLRPVGTVLANTFAEKELLARLDGTRTVASAAKGPRAPIVDFVLGACESGTLIEVPLDGRPTRAPTPAPAPARAATPRSAPAPQPVDYDAAMDLGRRHTREGSWDQAIAAFEAALSAQPNDRVALQNLRRVEQARAGHVEKSAFQWFRRG